MDRRTVLKNLTLAFGYAVATPTVLSVLHSCKTNVEIWTPLFFTETQGYMVTTLSDIILPKTDIVGALDVNVPEFMDKMLHDIAPKEKKDLIKEGADAFATEFQKVYGKDASKGTKEEYQQLVEKYFNISDDEKKGVFEIQDKGKPIEVDQLNTYLIYNFLITTREYTLYGYYTSEYVGEHILSYDPVPGSYEPCISVEDIGNASSL